jgi:hypothetical protein
MWCYEWIRRVHEASRQVWAEELFRQSFILAFKDSDFIVGLRPLKTREEHTR